MVNIVLFEPEIPQNTGNIGRTAVATGATLHLVKPMGFTIDDKALRRAGMDYWKELDVFYYENIAEFMQKNGNKNLYFFTTKSEQNYTNVSYEGDVYLVFGKESGGIPEDILVANKDRCVRLPMRDEIRSLNLSNAVCVGVYEVLRQNNFANLQEKGQLHHEKW